MRRRYAIIDVTTFEPTGRTVTLDLDSVRLTCVTVLADDLGGRLAAARSINLGRVHEDSVAAAESAGEFQSGERPPRSRRHWPVRGGSRHVTVSAGLDRDWRAGATQVGPPSVPR